MADDSAPPAGTSYDDHHDGNSTLSREEHLQAAGEHLAAASKLHGQHDDHMDAAHSHVQAVHDGDGRGGDGEDDRGGESARAMMPGAEHAVTRVASNPATARTFAAMRGVRHG